MICCAPLMVERRWVMTITVLSCTSASMACCTATSLSVSSAAVGSSKMMTGEFFKRARAMLMRCFSPPESLPPMSPTRVW